MTTIICEMDSMELCVWKEKHLQRACSGDEWIFREKEKEPEGIRVNFDVTYGNGTACISNRIYTVLPIP